MQLTRSQKRYASILGVCLLAFVTDRLILSPGTASADDTSVAATPAVVARPAPVATDAAELASAVTRSTLNASLEWIANERQLDPLATGDAFRPAKSWLPRREETPDAAPLGEDAARFREKHQLTAVMANGDLGYALVDGQRLRIGQTLDGFRLIEVKSRSIVLTDDRDQTVELELPVRKLTPAPKLPEKTKKTDKDEADKKPDEDTAGEKDAEGGDDDQKPKATSK